MEGTLEERKRKLSELALDYIHRKLYEDIGEEHRGEVTPEQIGIFCATIVEYTLYLRDELFGDE